MSERSTALDRAKARVTMWLDQLPAPMKFDATVALEGLVDVAEREIRQAYCDGYDGCRIGTLIAKAKDIIAAEDKTEDTLDGQ